MSTPINPLLAAQVISHAKGQELHQKHSAEKQEKDRLYAQKIQLAKQLQNQSKTSGAQKGFLA